MKTFSSDFMSLLFPVHFPCDRCGLEMSELPWCKCVECAHYFCESCYEVHECGVLFKCFEQLAAEGAAA